MRSFLIFWGGPLVFLWGWYFLSYYDLSMGMHFFSRELHDQVFTIYGNILGIAPESIPPLVARACVFDTGLVLLLIAFRRRRKIIAWIKAWRAERAERARYSEELPTVSAS
ncbi:DUF6105 family protein [Phyllobacterium sp. K27]